MSVVKKNVHRKMPKRVQEVKAMVNIENSYIIIIIMIVSGRHP